MGQKHLAEGSLLTYAKKHDPREKQHCRRINPRISAVVGSVFRRSCCSFSLVTFKDVSIAAAGVIP